MKQGDRVNAYGEIGTIICVHIWNEEERGEPCPFLEPILYDVEFDGYEESFYAGDLELIEES